MPAKSTEPAASNMPASLRSTGEGRRCPIEDRSQPEGPMLGRTQLSRRHMSKHRESSRHSNEVTTSKEYTKCPRRPWKELDAVAPKGDPKGGDSLFACLPYLPNITTNNIHGGSFQSKRLFSWLCFTKLNFSNV